MAKSEIRAEIPFEPVLHRISAGIPRGLIEVVVKWVTLLFDDVEEESRVSNQEPWRVSTKNGLDSSQRQQQDAAIVCKHCGRVCRSRLPAPPPASVGTERATS